jgi:Ca2+-binding RTX toxin-like protein
MAVPGLWDLGARTDQLTAAVRGWRALARAATVLGQRLRAATDPLAASWRGAGTDAYYTHRARVLDLSGTVSTVADAVATTLDAAVGTLTSGQAHLDDTWLRLTCAVADLAGHGSPLELLELSFVDGPVGDAVRAAAAEAQDIRDHVDAQLSGYASEVGRHRLRLEAPTRTLMAYVTPWLRPDELKSAGAVLLDGYRIIVNGTGGNDIIEVRTDADTSDLLMTVDGVVHRFPPGIDLVVRGGDGDDHITLDTSARVVASPGVPTVLQVYPVPDVTVLAGSGNDTVLGGARDDALYGLDGNDILQGRGGSDYLSGGSDNDNLDGGIGNDELAGGISNDVLYGLDGADRLWGGGGDDYLDGGAGEDLVTGGDGNDALVGGRGNDTVLGGGGDDRMYGGEGTDRLSGGPGVDNRAYAQSDDQVTGVAQRTDVTLTGAGSFVTVRGSAEFVDRVQSDLDALRSSPTGEEMLTTLQGIHHRTGDALLITQYDGQNGLDYPSDPPYPLASFDHVAYNPTWSYRDGPPLTTLYHEFAHVEDSFARTSASGTHRGPDDVGVRNLEREAVGLPIDDDNNPSTPDRLDPDHPYALTENALRQELGVPLRTTYA